MKISIWEKFLISIFWKNVLIFFINSKMLKIYDVICAENYIYMPTTWTIICFEKSINFVISRKNPSEKNSPRNKSLELQKSVLFFAISWNVQKHTLRIQFGNQILTTFLYFGHFSAFLVKFSSRPSPLIYFLF